MPTTGLLINWEREKAFYALLRKNTERLTKNGVDTLTSIALEDHKVCYKHVVALLSRQIRKAAPSNKLSIFYILSNIVRCSKRKNGAKDKYGGRVALACDDLFRALADCPKPHMPKIRKVLQSWKKDGVVSDADMGRIFKVLGWPPEAKQEELPRSIEAEQSSSEQKFATKGVERGQASSILDSGRCKLRHKGPDAPATCHREDEVADGNSVGGSNSGNFCSPTKNVSEEYDPLSAAHYLDGTSDADEKLGKVDLPPIPVNLAGLAATAGEDRSGVKRLRLGFDRSEEQTAGLNEAICLGIIVAGQALDQEAIHRDAENRVETCVGTSGQFHHIDYSGTWGFGQGLDGPPKIRKLSEVRVRNAPKDTEAKTANELADQGTEVKDQEGVCERLCQPPDPSPSEVGVAAIPTKCSKERTEGPEKGGERSGGSSAMDLDSPVQSTSSRRRPKQDVRRSKRWEPPPSVHQKHVAQSALTSHGRRTPASKREEKGHGLNRIERPRKSSRRWRLWDQKPDSLLLEK